MLDQGDCCRACATLSTPAYRIIPAFLPNPENLFVLEHRSPEEQATCIIAVAAMNGLGGLFKFACVEESSVAECQAAIANSTADIKVRGPAWVFTCYSSPEALVS